MILITHSKEEITNVKSVYFAEDGKLDIVFDDGKKTRTIEPSWVKEINA